MYTYNLKIRIYCQHVRIPYVHYKTISILRTTSLVPLTL